MIRALAKGSVLFAFGRLPGGPWAYRTLTRSAMGTQATHVDKLNRVWPGYVKVWRERCGFEPEGKTIGMYEGGWTPFPFLMAYLLTGKGGWVGNAEGHMHPRYTARAIDTALQIKFPDIEVPEERRHRLRELRDSHASLPKLIDAVGGSLSERTHPHRLPIEGESLDLLHSGGALEHLHPIELDAFLKECFRALRPGGISSNVFDLRDHLYHADKRYPFLNHLRFSEPAYRFWFGHPLLYHSRLSTGEIARHFESAGFEPFAMRRLVLPKGGYAESEEEVLAALCGLDRRRLSALHGSKTDLDLHTAAVHVLYRKPG